MTNTTPPSTEVEATKAWIRRRAFVTLVQTYVCCLPPDSLEAAKRTRIVSAALLLRDDVIVRMADDLPGGAAAFADALGGRPGCYTSGWIADLVRDHPDTMFRSDVTDL